MANIATQLSESIPLAALGLSRPQNRHDRRSRPKQFGLVGSTPLDRVEKALIMRQAAEAQAQWRERKALPRLTAAHLNVLHSLLFDFHRSKNGHCFPSYEAIARKAGCCRDTVWRAIAILEAHGLLSWTNRLARVRAPVDGLPGIGATRWRVVRTSNAYNFRKAPSASKSESQTGTLSPKEPLLTTRSPPTKPECPIDLATALKRFGEGVVRRKPP